MTREEQRFLAARWLRRERAMLRMWANTPARWIPYHHALVAGHALLRALGIAGPRGRRTEAR